MTEPAAQPRRSVSAWKAPALRLLLAAVLACLIAAPARAAEGEPRDQRVLVLHSYHPGYGWTDNIQRGAAEALARLAPQAHMFVEYMDTQRMAPERAFPILHDYFKAKYAGQPPDVILSSDDNALDFLLQYRDELFPGAAVVFCGAGDVESKHLENHKGYTGVVERTDLRATIDAALRLMPSMRRLVLVTGATENGETGRRLFRRAIPAYLSRVQPMELCGLPFAETAAQLTTLSPDAAILYMGLLRDPDGQTMTLEESLAFIRRATPQPVFCPWDFTVGRGVVGGVVVSGERQGRAMAEMAARILRGFPVDSMPIQYNSPSVGMFDHNELERAGFSESKLPPGSIVINRPEGLWQQHWVGILVLAGLFFAMSAAIILLLVNVRARRMAEARQSAERLRYQQFLEALSVGVIEVNRFGRILLANRACYSLCGAAPDSLPGNSLLDLAENPVSRDTLSRLLHEQECPPGSAIVRLRGPAGAPRDVKIDWICLHGGEGQPTGYLLAATDLTDLRQAERAREEQHRLTNALFDANPTPIVATDAEGRYVQVNRAMCEFIGLPAAEILERPLATVGQPAFAARMAELDRDLRGIGQEQSLETRLPDAAGTLREVIVTRAPYTDALGKPLGAVGTFTDITRRKQTEAELVESREKFRVMFESLPLAVGVTDGESRLLEVNKAFVDLHGCTRQDLLHKSLGERRFNLRRLDGSPLPFDEAPSQLAMRRQTLVRGDYFVQRPDGGTSCVQCTAVPLPLPGYGAIVALVDISEQRRMEQVIKSRLAAVTTPPTEPLELGFTDLFDLDDIQAVQDAFALATGVASVLTTPEGSLLTRPSNFPRDCRMERCAARGGEGGCLLLRPAGELPELPGLLTEAAPIMAGDKVIALWRMHQLRNGTDMDHAMAVFAEAGWKPARLRGCLETLPGTADAESFRHACDALALLAGKLSELAMQNVRQARSIEQQHRTEAALLQAKDLAEAASNAKSDFLANVSHELRTPLHGVIGMLELLRMTSLDETQADYLGKADFSARCLLSIINDILDFSKIESGGLELSAEVFDPAHLVRSSVAVFEEQAKAKGLSLGVSVDETLPKALAGDAGKLRQILFNLVGNAVKFTDKGSVKVEARTLPAKPGRAGLFLSVEDTGVGIAEDLQDMVFEPFVQGEDVYTKRFQGTGLGLAIVRRLVALMDGGITLDSRSGQGTRFEVALVLDLPAARRQEAARDAAQEGRPLPPLKLLLAEDNLISQLAAKSFLTRQGHSVTAVEDGQAILDTLENDRYDAVLMDIQMPVMDGVEAARLIRAHDGSRFDPAIPIIALTAYAQPEERRAFLAAGMNDTITKPLEPGDITAALARVLGPHPDQSTGADQPAATDQLAESD